MSSPTDTPRHYKKRRSSLFRSNEQNDHSCNQLTYPRESVKKLEIEAQEWRLALDRCQEKKIREKEFSSQINVDDFTLSEEQRSCLSFNTANENYIKEISDFHKKIVALSEQRSLTTKTIKQTLTKVDSALKRKIT